jgi:hypothetical protein
MCFFGSNQAAPPPDTQVAVAPTPRIKNDVADMFSRRRANARGAYGNIFTSPTGVTTRAPTSSTTLGGITNVFGKVGGA